MVYYKARTNITSQLWQGRKTLGLHSCLTNHNHALFAPCAGVITLSSTDVKMNIEVTISPNKLDLETISKGIQSFNQKHIPDEVVFEPDTKFAAFAKDANGKVVGGIRAVAFWNYCILELLWLSDEIRGQGVGSKLMDAAENFAKEKGFAYMRTETLSFQAKPFYEKRGYKVFGELPDHPKGHVTYCLVKEL